MLTLHAAGPHFGLPDPSPFCMKAEVLLKLAKLPYAKAPSSFRKAPKGKIPYLEDGGATIGDSTLIRLHLERMHGADFDRGHGADALALAWTAERMLEEHLYFIMVHERWCVKENFRKGPRTFFNAAPAPIRPFVRAMVARQVRKNLWAQGLGRHSRAELVDLGRRDLDSVSRLLNGNRYLLGETPCGADATAFAFLAGVMCPLFASDLRKHAEDTPNLAAYVKRMMAEFYPDFAPS